MLLTHTSRLMLFGRVVSAVDKAYFFACPYILFNR
jgi:hypothetical protein